ncbi:GntR family transcriptional regulator [Roseofilum capinflatum]|uniref:GntR family transcriptional regulator n=1 Tax=Roseofilum capinflatum BLCC-M114 TaxID=3022440 RepID=A0ABT7BA17_9CYAN|nr:GntR family transcriptional regulator [Roseofilum capinflatum]MDJ1176010.1 GntR family transcriptional regulator [Roseofilum capinflatum BLCC-M114]
MVKFQIQPDSDIPASNQLFNQLRFAIASGQYPPGSQLPSTRALAMQTGLHRNTISKVYRQLEETGLVEAQAGSGIYVRQQGQGFLTQYKSQLLQTYPQAQSIVQNSLNQLIQQGCSLHEARELFLTEIDWRLRCSARVLVTAPTNDIGVGQLMMEELQAALHIPVQLVPLEELDDLLNHTRSATVVTSRYFFGDAEKIAAPKSARVVPVEIYDYASEVELVKGLPKGTYFGVVSLSHGILRAVEVIIHSLRGDDVLVMTAHRDDPYKLNAMVRTVQYIVSDVSSYDAVKAALQAAREDIIRPPRLIQTDSYIDQSSINRLKRELGLD